MSGAMRVVAVILIVLGLIFGSIGAILMFSYVPGKLDDAQIPDDLDKHYVYGGYISKLDTSTGQLDEKDFTIDRHVVNVGDAKDGHIYIETEITATDNDTGLEIDDLYNFTKYEVHPKELTLFGLESEGGYNRTIPGSENVNYVFPMPVEEKDYLIYNSNILGWSTAHYLGKEDRGGIECFVFRGEEGYDEEFEIPLPTSIATALGPFADDTKMTIKLWEKVWVHPLSGSIIDYAKEIYQYLYLPELPEIPEIIYPSDLMSTTGFDGAIMLFDQATGSFNTMNGITAERVIEVVDTDGHVYTADETVNVFAPDGSNIDILGSAVQVIFNATDGGHEGMGRFGHYLFPPTGVEMIDYSIWDDGFNKMLTAAYIGNKSFGDLAAYEYKIDVENETYLAGGVASMDMTYWVEVTTGIVLDVDKHVVNWRPQPARRLPTDTSLINKTVHMNATVTQINPITQEVIPMEIVVEQTINCSGYTDATFSVALIEETVTKLFYGTPMAPPTVSRFGVNAVSMEYTDVANWSTVARTGGVFTFPLGILNEIGEVTPSFVMYNSDLGIVMPAVLTEEVVFNGLEAAVYEMSLTDHPLDYSQLVAALSGQDPGIPGASGLYTGSATYTVDVDTGTILDVERTTLVKIVPPSYEFLWDNLNSTSILNGEFMGENITVTQILTGSEADDGTTEITIVESTKYDNGTDFLPQNETAITINTTSHEILESGVPTGLYFLFPKNPTEASYQMAQNLGPYTMVSAAIRGTETDGTVAYNWTGDVVADGALIGMAGVDLNVTMWYNFLVDKNTGMVLDVNVEIMLENGTYLPAQMLSFSASDDTKTSSILGNAVMGWAISEMPAEVLSAEMSLYEMEVAYNIGKATVTQGLFDVADGDKPALDLHIYFNETTKATMVATAEGTLALLTQLEGLNTLHGLDTILGLYDNQVIHAYYTQIEEDPEGSEIEGSVEYHGAEAKKIDDYLALRGTTIPVATYVVALVLVIVGISLILVGGKEEEVPEEEKEDEPSENEEGEDTEEGEAGEEGEGTEE